jgi:photosystem II stability/assembly factor-like uncharacterized protein
MSTRDRCTFELAGPHFFGHVVNHIVSDPREPNNLVAAVRAGHLGPTVYRSHDWGKTWHEAKRPPAFRKAPQGKEGRSVDHVFWLTPGHPSQPRVWWAGTSPHGLFRSEDDGDTWIGVSGFNDHPERPKWSGPDADGPPDGATTHSILIDPRHPDRMYLGLSGGGFFTSEDGGAGWQPLNKGCALDFMPEELREQDWGHDPHCVQLHPLKPDRLYQQNHCGIYRMDRPHDVWIRIGDNMPKSVGDIGFPMTLHPRDPDTAWVFPMDGGTVWPRTSPEGKPAVYVTRNAGQTWQRQDNGLPNSQAWYTVKRQCLAADDWDPVGLYFGTTSGAVWHSADEGQSWTNIAMDLPHIYSIEAARS